MLSTYPWAQVSCIAIRLSTIYTPSLMVNPLKDHDPLKVLPSNAGPLMSGAKVFAFDKSQMLPSHSDIGSRDYVSLL